MLMVAIKRDHANSTESRWKYYEHKKISETLLRKIAKQRQIFQIEQRN